MATSDELTHTSSLCTLIVSLKWTPSAELNSPRPESRFWHRVRRLRESRYAKAIAVRLICHDRGSREYNERTQWRLYFHGIFSRYLRLHSGILNYRLRSKTSSDSAECIPRLVCPASAAADLSGRIRRRPDSSAAIRRSQSEVSWKTRNRNICLFS